MIAFGRSGVVEQSLQILADRIRSRHRDCLDELVIEIVRGGIVLSGRARSFYGKQIAYPGVAPIYPASALAFRANAVPAGAGSMGSTEAAVTGPRATAGSATAWGS